MSGFLGRSESLQPGLRFPAFDAEYGTFKSKRLTKSDQESRPSMKLLSAPNVCTILIYLMLWKEPLGEKLAGFFLASVTLFL